jgi:hypothetical protein
MALDDVCLARLRTRRFDDVRINRALCQPANAFEPGSLFLEYFDEQPADDLALALRVVLALELLEKAIFSIDTNHANTHVFRESFHDLVAFVKSQQAVIHEDAGELLADCPVQQRADDRRINAA